MKAVFHLKLRAVDSVKNIDRDYEILAMKVLLGHWGVTVAFGRHGTKGDFRNHVFDSQEEAQRFVYKTIQKRLRAPRRNGCCYHLVSASALKQEDLASWVALEQREKFDTPS